MAVYFLRGGHISRGKGARATRAAAYRAGERIRDERTSEVYDHSDRDDIAHKEIVLPADLAGRDDMAWTQDRATLWNAAEHAGLRRNSRIAREWLVIIPSELNPTQRTELVRAFAKELADKYRSAVDLAIHQPRPGADARNHHAHLLMTVREVSPEGFGPYTTLDMQDRKRREAGMSSSREEYLSIRARWAEVTNNALQRAGVVNRVDHRSFKHQGIDKEPTPTIPEKVFYAERKGGRSAAGDAIRARHRERLEARKESPEALGRVIERQKQQLKAEAREHFKRLKAEPKSVRWGSLSRAERNAIRREQYAERRAIERKDPAFEAQRREASRLAARERQQRNPEGIRAARRRWWHANKDSVNEKQRNYRHARAERAKRAGPSAEQSARNWRAYRNQQATSPTAEDSARAWREQRERGVSSPSAAPAQRTHDAGTRPRERDTKPGSHPTPDRQPDLDL